MPPKKQPKPKQQEPIDDKAVATQATEPAEDKKQQQAPASKKTSGKKYDTKARNCSIQVGKEVLDTVAGPIYEWLPVPENLPKHPTLAHFGKRRTGKSTTITNILYQCCQHIPFGLVVSYKNFAVFIVVAHLPR